VQFGDVEFEIVGQTLMLVLRVIMPCELTGPYEGFGKSIQLPSSELYSYLLPPT
jgi:hypothetical protein